MFSCVCERNKRLKHKTYLVLSELIFFEYFNQNKYHCPRPHAFFNTNVFHLTDHNSLLVYDIIIKMQSCALFLSAWVRRQSVKIDLQLTPHSGLSLLKFLDEALRRGRTPLHPHYTQRQLPQRLQLKPSDVKGTY